MATKRPHSAIHPSRTAQVPAEPLPKRARKEKPSHISGPSFKKAHTVHDLKSTIRSLRRLLEHNDDLPATVRVDKERALRSAEGELAETERAKKRSEVIGRWHKVRFFERQKATKRVKRLRKEVIKLQEGAEGKEDLVGQLKDAEVDVAYAVYYPLERDYVLLFAKRKVPGGDGEEGAGSPEPNYERQGDPEMWQRVKRCMADGTLDDLRNGNLEVLRDGEEAAELATETPAQPKTTTKKREKAKKPPPPPVEGNRRERRKAAATAKAESDEDDGESFFE